MVNLQSPWRNVFSHNLEGNRVRIRPLIGLGLSLVWSASYCAETALLPPSSPPPNAIKEADSKSQFASAAIDLSAPSLPIGYVGNDLKTIYSAIRQIQKNNQKGEYETTDQFRERIQNENAKPLAGALSLNDSFTFVTTPRSTYDADTKVLALMVSTTDALDGDNIDSSKSRIAGPYLYKRESTYSGSNAYGAQMTVRKMESEEIGIVFLNKKKLPTVKTPSSTTIQLNVENIPPEIARNIRNNIRIAFIYKTEKPYLSEGLFTNKPTRGDPTDWNIREQNVLANIEQIWAFNIFDGRIFLKFKTVDGN